uniref:Uncharacterized protein n=1 Tax=Panagrolaimus sp. ES5 TaxID=591445 RepID=A0AC34FQS4_9BILA
MFIVSKPNLLPSFAGLSAMMKVDACEAIASSTAALDYFEDELRGDYDIDSSEIDIIAKLSSSPSNSRSASGSSSCGGLKRSVSTIQAGTSSLTADSACTHSTPNHKCIVEARQIEIDVASLTSDDFWLCISSPNGESSGKMRFEKYGKTQRFSPRANGCGHGHWTIEIFVKNSDGKTFTKKSETKEYLDGVGSLFFTVNDNYNLKLASQEFLRLPSACNSCTSQIKKPEKSAGGLMRSAKFW